LEVTVVVEIPKGTRNKYEFDDDGRIWLDRTLFTSTTYPEDYGHVPETIGEDGDPLDAMVILGEPTFPGCYIRARPVGLFRMRDEEGTDEKMLCVPAGDPRWHHVVDLDDLPEFELHEIAHFFDIYKDLEPGKGTTTLGWADREAAEAAVVAARDRYAARRPN
jgi:inorganic pyrophosphatase